MYNLKIAIAILLILLLFIKYFNISESFQSNITYKFTDLLKARRRIERLDGIKKYVELTNENYKEIKKNNPDFFFTLVDSGNLGSKENSEFYATKLNINTIPKYFTGNINDLNHIDSNLESFVIKPTNLNNSNGLMIIKNRKCILSNKQFKSNNEIIEYYKNKYKNMNFNVICQKYISSNIRPIELKLYSFSGFTPIIIAINWVSPTKRDVIYYDNNWKKIVGKRDILKPKNLNNILRDANKFTKEINTFMRIDFLIDEDTKEYFFCETSSYPKCAKNEDPIIDTLLAEYWKTSFPFKNNDINEIFDKSLKWTKKEKCEQN